MIAQAFLAVHSSRKNQPLNVFVEHDHTKLEKFYCRPITPSVVHAARRNRRQNADRMQLVTKRPPAMNLRACPVP